MIWIIKIEITDTTIRLAEKWCAASVLLSCITLTESAFIRNAIKLKMSVYADLIRVLYAY